MNLLGALTLLVALAVCFAMRLFFGSWSDAAQIMQHVLIIFLLVESGRTAARLSKLEDKWSRRWKP